MAVITLPSSPAPSGARIMLLDFGALLTPYTGGPSQRLNRIGMRMGASVTLPPMRSDGAAMTVVSRLMQARTQELLIDCPMAEGDWPTAGTNRVKVAVTGGTTLQIKSLPAGYPLAEGRPFSILSGGRRYVHFFAAAGTANGAGDFVASVWPPMRASFSVDDLVEIDAPKMQGHVVDDQVSWQMALARRTSLSFTLHEAR